MVLFLKLNFFSTSSKLQNTGCSIQLTLFTFLSVLQFSVCEDIFDNLPITCPRISSPEWLRLLPRLRESPFRPTSDSPHQTVSPDWTQAAGTGMWMPSRTGKTSCKQLGHTLPALFLPPPAPPPPAVPPEMNLPCERHQGPQAGAALVLAHTCRISYFPLSSSSVLTSVFPSLIHQFWLISQLLSHTSDGWTLSSLLKRSFCITFLLLQ